MVVIGALTNISKLKLDGEAQLPNAPPWEQKVQSECVPELSPKPISGVADA